MSRMIGSLHDVGYGGKKCSCCYHPPSHRKTMNRKVKRRERQVWRREVNSLY